MLYRRGNLSLRYPLPCSALIQAFNVGESTWVDYWRDTRAVAVCSRQLRGGGEGWDDDGGGGGGGGVCVCVCAVSYTHLTLPTTAEV